MAKKTNRTNNYNVVLQQADQQEKNMRNIKKLICVTE